MNVIYIASPYAIGDTAVNVQRQVVAAHELMDYGFAPIVPLLSHYLHMHKARPDREWLEVDLELIKRLDPDKDGLLRLSGRSHGADQEVDLALWLGIPVFVSVNELLKYFKVKK